MSPGKGGHARNVLSNTHNVGEQVVQHLVHDHHVNDCLNVSGCPKVLVIASCISQIPFTKLCNPGVDLQIKALLPAG